jgi:PAS domain S-box-containing protein
MGACLQPGDREHVLAQGEAVPRNEPGQGLFELSPDGLLLIQNGVFATCNEACASIYGYSREEMIGRTPEDFSAPVQSDGRPSADHVPERQREAREKACRASNG